MRKTLYILILSAIAYSACTSEPAKTVAVADENMDLFAQHAKLVQGYFDAFCSKDSAKVSSFISDTVVRIAPGYGDTSTSKSYWMKICKGWWPLFFDLTTKDVVMLPAINPTTLKPDGNVSVYATWVDNAVNGIKIIHKYHGLFKFNKDHKIIFADEYLDAGGMFKEATAPKK